MDCRRRYESAFSGILLGVIVATEVPVAIKAPTGHQPVTV